MTSKEIRAYNPEQKPNRMVKAAQEIIKRLFAVSLEGKEYLREIPKDKRVVVAATHLSDFDPAIAVSALADRFPNMRVADESTHYYVSQNAAAYVGRILAGSQSFFRIDYSGKGERTRRGIFNPKNFEPMRKALMQGDAVLITAYYDPKYVGEKWQLPDKGGYGAVFLAETTPQSVVLPVAVDIMSKEEIGLGKVNLKTIKELAKKPAARAIVGRPIYPKKIPNIKRWSDLIGKKLTTGSLTSEERKEYLSLSPQIREDLSAQSDTIMRSLSDNLPKEKRGRWSKS